MEDRECIVRSRDINYLVMDKRLLKVKNYCQDNRISMRNVHSDRAFGKKLIPEKGKNLKF